MFAWFLTHRCFAQTKAPMQTCVIVKRTKRWRNRLHPIAPCIFFFHHSRNTLYLEDESYSCVESKLILARRHYTHHRLGSLRRCMFLPDTYACLLDTGVMDYRERRVVQCAEIRRNWYETATSAMPVFVLVALLRTMVHTFQSNIFGPKAFDCKTDAFCRI